MIVGATMGRGGPVAQPRFGPQERRRVQGYDTTGDGRLDAFDTTRDGASSHRRTPRLLPPTPLLCMENHR